MWVNCELIIKLYSRESSQKKRYVLQPAIINSTKMFYDINGVGEKIIKIFLNDLIIVKLVIKRRQLITSNSTGFSDYKKNLKNMKINLAGSGKIE